ncbi:protein-tyrosine phosphatase-like protein [Obelidium mucronatum]|nr:protein-tyrosine phosphatase-like protein [Obelidium mucronatum]
MMTKNRLMNGFVLEDREERKKLRGLMGGVAKRVGPPPAMGVNGSQAREAKKRTTWRVKMYDFPIEDTPAAPIRWIFEKCCEVVEAARLLGENVLIHCHAGVSRSSTIILAYLMRFQKLTLYEAWLLTYKARPIIRPNEGFARALQELEREIHPHLTEPTLPIFWMCDSYANFMELLELRERANRAGLLKPIDASSPTSASGIPASVTSDECRCGNHCKLCECGLRCECQCGASRLSQLPGPVGGMVGASIIDSGAAVEETEPFPPVRKGRSRGLSFGGRAG